MRILAVQKSSAFIAGSSYQEAEGPLEVFCQLWEFCHRLEPERRTKEQILELVILEHFLTILPKRMQSWVREEGPETCFQAVALAEEFMLIQPESPEEQTRPRKIPRGAQRETAWIIVAAFTG